MKSITPKSSKNHECQVHLGADTLGYLDNEEIKTIKKIHQILSSKSAQVELVASNGEEILIPESVYNLFGQIVRAMSSGQGVSIVTYNSELTVHQAANLLNVSQSFILKLLEEGAIPYIEVGSRRRIVFQDLMTYKQQHKVQRRQSLDKLIKMTEEAGLYEE
jgi:excisionase family DNA binding protein